MKDKVLELLRSHREQPLSGQALSNQLGVSRTAIWKHINSLREEGYDIISQPGTGYLLDKVPDLLLPAELAPYLKGEKFGTIIDYHSQIASTNNRAKSLADEGETTAPEGTLVIAEEQAGGKGRLGRKWFSPQGTGIYVSLILRPSLKPEQAAGLTLLAAVALAQAVHDLTGLRPGIKWPNDLLLNGKKFAGILTEMKGEIDLIHYLVVGTGINVNTEMELFPPELQDQAISLATVLGRKISRIELLAGYLGIMENLYQVYQTQGFAPIKAMWKEWNITLGQTLAILSGTREYTGVAVDIDANGGLIIQGEDGQEQVFHSGEVTIKKT